MLHDVDVFLRFLPLRLPSLLSSARLSDDEHLFPSVFSFFLFEYFFRSSLLPHLTFLFRGNLQMRHQVFDVEYISVSLR